MWKLSAATILCVPDLCTKERIAEIKGTPFYKDPTYQPVGINASHVNNKLTPYSGVVSTDWGRKSQPRAKLCRSSTSSISSSCWYCVHCTASSEPSSGVGASCDIVHLGASENLDDVHDVWHTRHVPRETLLMPHRRRRAAASARPRRCAADALSVQHPPPQYRNPPPFSASYKRDEMILQPP